ncbi:MAG: beta-mannosidase [Acidobacteriota bacterium]|nr:MAG: beta-mannosidase [Acidobacteriota bacterium]
MKLNRIATLLTIGVLWTANASFTPTPSPSDPDADANVRTLFAKLHRLSRLGTLFGHQDDRAYGVHWKEEEVRSDVFDVCGDFPAVSGWDLGELGKERNLDGVSFDKMQQWMIDIHRRGGINTVSWHMVNLANDSNSWDTTRSVQRILPGGDLHGKFLSKLDLFAAFANDLQVDGELVPLIFRPWHEHNGNWFWWGAAHCSVEEYKSLWRFTVEYLRDRKGVHSLLYAYSPNTFQSEAEYLERYPGDEYIDILGFDDYANVRDSEERSRKNLARQIQAVVRLAGERGKLPAWTETGLEGLSNPNWFTSILLNALTASPQAKHLTWVLVWRNANAQDKSNHFYGPHPQHPSAADFRRFYQDPLTLFLRDISE